MDDEKHEFGDMTRQASQRTTATAPRLSLRPVTQFLPNLGEKRQSRGNALNIGRPVAQNVERSITAQSNNRENPFGNHAETIDATNARGPEIVQGMSPGGEIMTGTTAAAAVVGLTRGASKRGFGPNPIDLTKKGPSMGPPSPAATEFSVSSESSPAPAQTASGAAIAAAGGPINSAVHRVQLDFKPSMDDELELRAGQLIRLLHEYDDGWVSHLCIFQRALTNVFRLSAFVLIVLSKVLFLEHVFQPALSSLVHNKMVPEVLHHLACVFHNNHAQCHQLADP
jgi:hypothetical protein